MSRLLIAHRHNMTERLPNGRRMEGICKLNCSATVTWESSLKLRITVFRVKHGNRSKSQIKNWWGENRKANVCNSGRERQDNSCFNCQTMTVTWRLLYRSLSLIYRMCHEMCRLSNPSSLLLPTGLASRNYTQLRHNIVRRESYI